MNLFCVIKRVFLLLLLLLLLLLVVFTFVARSRPGSSSFTALVLNQTLFKVIPPFSSFFS